MDEYVDIIETNGIFILIQVSVTETCNSVHLAKSIGVSVILDPDSMGPFY